jgi:hypothetical protein
MSRKTYKLGKQPHRRVIQRILAEGYGGQIMSRRFARAMNRGDRIRKSQQHMVVLRPEGWVVLEGSGLIHKGRKP